MPAARPHEIATHLSEADEDLARLIALIGPPPSRRPIPVADRFARLATSILHQQLAGKAAATITGRVEVALGGTITATGLLDAPDGQLRRCGVSDAKQRALLDLAWRVESGELALGSLGRMSDEDVIDSLSEIRGIGRWTAEMFLMGPLGRHDVWPVGDLGVRNGWAVIRSLPEAPSAAELEQLGDGFRPYRSSVAWYCWRAVDVARSSGGALPE